MTSDALLRRLPNDIGGAKAAPIDWKETPLEPWEKRCHALADVLDFQKLINTEDKRKRVEALGTEVIGHLNCCERWIAAFANILFQKGILSPKELALRMRRIENESATG